MTNEASIDQHLTDIGKVVSNMNVVETELVLLTTALMGPEQHIGLAIVADQGFAKIANMCRRLAHVRLAEQPTARDALLDWVRQAEGAQKMRSRIVHAKWLSEEPNDKAPQEILEITARKGKLRTEMVKLGPGEVRDAVVACRSVLDEFRSLVVTLRKAAPDIAHRIESDGST